MSAQVPRDPPARAFVPELDFERARAFSVVLMGSQADAPGMRISEAARRSGLGVHTLRYYERAGLIESIERGTGGERRYASKDLRWIHFLKRLRATGMPVRDMQRFAQLRRAGPTTDGARRELLAAHRLKVLATIEQLQSGLEAIDVKLERLTSGIDHDEHGDQR